MADYYIAMHNNIYKLFAFNKMIKEMGGEC